MIVSSIWSIYSRWCQIIRLHIDYGQPHHQPTTTTTTTHPITIKLLTRFHYRCANTISFENSLNSNILFRLKNFTFNFLSSMLTTKKVKINSRSRHKVHLGSHSYVFISFQKNKPKKYLKTLSTTHTHSHSLSKL